MNDVGMWPGSCGVGLGEQDEIDFDAAVEGGGDAVEHGEGVAFVGGAFQAGDDQWGGVGGWARWPGVVACRPAGPWGARGCGDLGPHGTALTMWRFSEPWGVAV